MTDITPIDLKLDRLKLLFKQFFVSTKYNEIKIKYFA